MLLTLESSGRWPDDLEGIQKIKSAFLAKIGEGLEETRAVLTANVVFDLNARPVDDNVSLEILTASGFAFRARISFERSLILHRDRVAQLGEAATPAYRSYKRRFVHLPRHHGGISAVQHQFTSYSHTVRLVKRWFSTHMLLPHFDEEQIELVVASTFLDPASLHEPAQSGATGFARVMERLASWKWRDEPLFVPLYTFQTAVSSGRRAAFPTAKRAKARAAFEALRLADPAVNEQAWVIVTEEDLRGHAWGRKTDKVVAARTKSLAKATLKTLNDGLVNGGLVPQVSDAGYHYLMNLGADLSYPFIAIVHPSFGRL
jgi:U3 small nucleolar RNA-associated protein 22